MESIWTRAFNSFGFIALLVCAAVLLTVISASSADDGRDPAGDLRLLQSQGALVTENRGAPSDIISRHAQYN